MAGYYSVDLRKKVLKMVERGINPRTVASDFDIGKSTIYEWIKRDSEGKLEPCKLGPKTAWKIDKDKLIEFVKNNPDLYLYEIAEEFGVTEVGIHKSLSKSGITYKKKSTIHRKR